MASSTSLGNISEASAGARSSVVLYLRLEALAVAIAAVVLYARTGASWWLFLLWPLPDLSMLGYLASPCRGARYYNAVHSYVLPAVLAAAGLLLRAPLMLPLSLIWINHIAVDRLLGYGLKYSDGFGYTHLGRVDKAKG
jgi:hypothetical protein